MTKIRPEDQGFETWQPALERLLDRHQAELFDDSARRHGEIMAAIADLKESIMAIADDVQTNYDALVAKVDKLKTTDDSLVAFVNGLKQQIIDLSKQLADAIAAGADPAKLQAISDGLVALGTSVDAIEAKDAIVATP